MNALVHSEGNKPVREEDLKKDPQGIDLRSGQHPCIGPGFRLQWEPAQDCHVLLYPEGMVKLNQSAGEILKRCDGTQTLSTLISTLEEAFQTEGLAAEVTNFLHWAQQQRWIVWR